jgi:hypothetical protein
MPPIFHPQNHAGIAKGNHRTDLNLRGGPLSRIVLPEVPPDVIYNEDSPMLNNEAINLNEIDVRPKSESSDPVAEVEPNAGIESIVEQ